MPRKAKLGAKKPRKLKEVEQTCSITLKANFTEYKAEGNSVDECVSKLSVPYLRGPGVFTVTKDGKTSTAMLNRMLTLKVLSNPSNREMLVKKLEAKLE